MAGKLFCTPDMASRAFCSVLLIPKRVFPRGCAMAVVLIVVDLVDDDAIVEV
jgi:hypothetical protein